MPSGPKKRLRAKRKKQGSPAIDVNSDRETEALSVTGSVDVDDTESGLDVSGTISLRPAFLDRDVLSSQTDEWVRVSNFDVGTPTSQTEENDPSREDADIRSSRRSLDKLAEWETVSGEHIPERQEGSIHNLVKEPSICEAASTHSSESYANLPSPHLAKRGSDSDNPHSDGKKGSAKKSTCSCCSATSTEAKSASASAETRDLPPVPTSEDGRLEEIGRSNVDSVEDKRASAVTKDPELDPVMSDPTPQGKTPDGESEGEEKLSTSSVKESSAKEDAVDVSLVNIEKKEVSTDEKIISPRMDESAAADDSEVASSSADARKETIWGDTSRSEVGNFISKNSIDPQELTADALSGKNLPISGISEPTDLGEVRHSSLSMRIEKDGAEKHLIEPKSFTGCCGVLYWLLGWDQ